MVLGNKVAIFDWEWDRNTAPRDGQKIPWTKIKIKSDSSLIWIQRVWHFMMLNPKVFLNKSYFKINSNTDHLYSQCLNSVIYNQWFIGW